MINNEWMKIFDSFSNTQFEELHKDETLQPFFVKGYSFYLLKILYSNCFEKEELSIFEIYLLIPKPKHQYCAFRAYVKQLERLGLVQSKTSSVKKSKKLLELSEHSFESINAIIDTQF